MYWYEIHWLSSFLICFPGLPYHRTSSDSLPGHIFWYLGCNSWRHIVRLGTDLLLFSKRRLPVRWKYVNYVYYNRNYRQCPPDSSMKYMRNGRYLPTLPFHFVLSILQEEGERHAERFGIHQSFRIHRFPGDKSLRNWYYRLFSGGHRVLYSCLGGRYVFLRRTDRLR